MEKVYSMYWEHDGENAPMIEPLNGDFKKVFPTGYGFTQEKQDALSSAIRLEDRTYINKSWGYQGVAVDLTHVPTKALFKSNGYALPDILQHSNWFMVSNKFRQVVEGLEPGKHQFSVVELVDKAGEHVVEYFWFNPCARIDSADRDHTTHELYKGRAWRQLRGCKYVFNLSQIGDAQIWIDPLTSSGTIFITQRVKDALSGAGLEGLGHGELNAVRGS